MASLVQRFDDIYILQVKAIIILAHRTLNETLKIKRIFFFQKGNTTEEPSSHS